MLLQCLATIGMFNALDMAGIKNLSETPNVLREMK